MVVMLGSKVASGRPGKTPDIIAFVPAAVWVVLLLAQGCTALGPKALSQGRPAYNDAIAQTNAEQNLAWIVRTRYGLTPSQLAVSSITANMNFSSSAGVNLAVGPEQSYEGNLVPLSGEISFDENPTISYVPVEGDPYIRALMSPIPLDLVILLLSNADDPELAATMLLQRVNRIPNPAFHEGAALDPRFDRVIHLLEDLVNADKLAIAQAGDGQSNYMVWIHDYGIDRTKQVREFLELLGIGALDVDGEDIALPLLAGVRPIAESSIVIQTRSVYELGRIAASTVDISPEDLKAGLAIEYPEVGAAGDFVEIKRARQRPAIALAATRFRGWWYYVAGNDPASKEYFRIFDALMSVRIAEATEGTLVAPILTVPVSR